MNCTYCHSPNDPDARFCGECGQTLFEAIKGPESEVIQERAKSKRIRPPFLVALTIFCSVLLAALAFLVYERTRAVAYVNGEKISFSDWQSEVTLLKPQIESRYGPAVFKGPEGQENYQAFRYQVLQTLIIDYLIQQEARKLNLSVAPEEVQSRLISMVGMKGPALEEYLKQQGLSQAQALRILKRELLQERLVSFQLNRQGMLSQDPRLYSQASQIYLNNLWSRAQIRFADKELRSSSQKSSASCACCGSGSAGSTGTGGCGTKSTLPLDPKIEQEAREAALKAYREKYGQALVTATVTNYGCHVQMDIIEGRKTLKSYAYREGKAWEIN